MKQMIYIEPKSTDAAFHFSVEEYCTKRFDGAEPIWMLWRTERCAMLGRNQIADVEIDMGEAERLGVQTVRRLSGGGTIFTDMGVLLFTVILPFGQGDDATRLLLENAAEPVVRALREKGANAEIQGRNDILVDGKKVSGMAQYILNGKLCSHGSLLVNADLDSLANVLRVDPEKFKTKALRSVKARVANISEYTETPCDANTFLNDLRQSLLSSSAAREYILTERDTEQINAIRAAKYANPEWTFGKSPKFSFGNARRFAGGKVEISLETEKNTIVRCGISGDFLALRPIRELEALIEGAAYRPDAVKRRIADTNMRMYIGSVTDEEFISCMFGNYSNPTPFPPGSEPAAGYCPPHVASSTLRGAKPPAEPDLNEN
ncbi:MAG: lipoate--protein ligase [Clostridiales Family XIII bacterium]|jgi:lipoate-protein ligase A|nr:lipoate--protein ligase [Clostridiales Family XIII bacterium]